MTEQRRVIAKVLSDSIDHPDVEALHRRAVALDPNISIATVYRTVRLFEEANILERHDFGQPHAVRRLFAPAGGVDAGRIRHDHQI